MRSMDDHKIRQALSAAHEKKAETDIPDGWQNDVMRRIRNLQADDSAMLAVFFNRLVWRFAAFACVLVMVLSLISFHSGFQTEYELAQFFIEDPLNVSLMQSFGI